MSRLARLLTVTAVWLLSARAGAQTPPSTDRAQALAASLRGLLLQWLPQPLYEKAPGWGATKEVTTGIKWKGKLHLRPEPVRGQRNHGDWRKVRMTADNPANTLVLELRNVRPGGDGKTLFTAFIAANCRVEYEHQKWDAGVRLYSASARARLRITMTLDCELTSRLVPTGGVLPDLVFRVRVTRADARYDHFVVEHVVGVGGDAAKLLGEAIQGGAKRLHPSIERHLLEKANAAVEKAADTKEIRLGLSGLLKP
jgi:hypothetical protein